MRHSTAHVMAEAVLDLFPGTKLGIGPALAEGFYYDFDIPRRLTPDDLAAIEDRMRASVAADHPFVRRGGRVRRRPCRGRGPGPGVQGRDPRRPRREGRGRRRGAAAGDLLRARAVQRPVPRAARRDDREDRAVQAPVGRRGVLAGRREAPDAPADLRHGLAHGRGAEGLPVAARGGEEARPPPARRPARPVQLPRRQPWARRSGIPRASCSGGSSRTRCACSRPGATTRKSPRRSS